MKYCYQCNRITPGEPLYCNYCGRSYNVKLCPRRHVNPRSAEACSQCGSRDLSTPQPKVPFWVPVVEFLVSLIPGTLLTALTIALFMLVIHELIRNPNLLASAVCLLISLGILWWIWSQLPRWFRTAVYKMLRRKRERTGEKGER